MDEAPEGTYNTATSAQKESAIAKETAFDQVNGVASGMLQSNEGSGLDVNAAAMTEQEMIQSKNAIVNSIGEK